VRCPAGTISPRASGTWIWAFTKAFTFTERVKRRFGGEFYDLFDHLTTADMYVEGANRNVSPTAFIPAMQGIDRHLHRLPQRAASGKTAVLGRSPHWG
jgi:hypothetical protein